MDAQEWNVRYGGEALLWKAEPNPFLAEVLSDTVPGRAVDLACGEGRNAIWLARQGWRVTGVDFSEVALAKAERRAMREGIKIDWVLDDVLSFQALPPVDLIVVSFLHLPTGDRRAVLARSSAALSPGGRVIVVGYDLTNSRAGGAGVTDQELLFSPEQIAQELAGLHIERAERLCLTVASAKGPLEVVDTFVVARRLSGAPGRDGAKDRG